jgi:hypothetical protein
MQGAIDCFIQYSPDEWCFDTFEGSRGLAHPPRYSPSMALRIALQLAAAAIDLNIQVPDLLPQRIAVETKQIRGADLVATGGR